MVIDIIEINIKENTSPQHVARKTSEAIEAFQEKVEATNCKCGQESEYGCHGVKNYKVYDEFYCKSCYNKRGNDDLNE